MRSTKAAEASAIERQHLTSMLLGQIERTYGVEGQPGMLRVVTDLLRRLDDTALREYAYSMGLTSERELEPEEEAGRPRTAEETP